MLFLKHSISRNTGLKIQISLLIVIGYLSIAESETCMSQDNQLMPYLMPCEEMNMDTGSGDDVDAITPLVCPQPDCIKITLDKPNLVVNFGLSCLPMMDLGCQYNYTVEFYPPNSSTLLSFDNRMITETELNETRFLLSPSLLLEDLEYFEMGVVVNVTIILESGNQTDGQFIIDGDFTPSVRNLNATGSSNTTVDLSWTLPFPVVTPDSYVIRYNYMRLEGTVMTNGEGSVTVNNEGSTTYTLSNLEPYSLYGISVITVYNGAESDNATVTIETMEGVSSSVQSLTINTDDQQLAVMWVEPVYPAGIILSYEVMITREGSPTTVATVNSNVSDFVSDDFDFFTNYSVTVTPINGFGGGLLATEMVTTPQGAPTPPLNFSVQSINPNSLTASWTQPMDLNGILTNYTVYCRLSSDQFYPEQEPSEEQQFTVRTSVDPSYTSANVTGLQPFTTYDCYVTASTDGGQSEPSNNETTRTDEAEPSPPINFTVQAITATTITVSWSRPVTPNGEIIEYHIDYLNSSLMDPLSIDIPVMYSRDSNEYNVTSITIYHLNEFTNYTINISAINGQEAGPSLSLTVRTNEAAPSAPPMSLTGVNISSTSIFISWDPPSVNDRNGIILGYNITYSSTNEDTMFASTSNTSITLTDLLVFTDYTISVVAYTSVESGPSTPEITIKTDSDLPFQPTNLSVPFINATTIVIEWDPPTVVRGNRMGYTVRYYLAPYDYSYLLTNYSPIMLGEDERSVSLTMLHEFAEYVIIVQAENDKGLGNNATIIRTTNESIPGDGVQNVSVCVLNSTAVNISWYPPMRSDWNGLLTMYTVSYQSMDDTIGSSINGTLDLPLQDFVNGLRPRNASDPLQRESILITGLQEAINYTFTVTVSTVIGPNMAADTPPSTPATTAQDVPSGPPLDINVTVLSSLSARVTWSPPQYLERNGLILGYRINISDTNGNVLVSQRVENVNYYLAENLPQFATFSIIVSAVTSQGQGPSSTPISEMTFEGLPSQPTSVRLSAASQTSINVTWLTPSPPNGIIIGYYIFYYGQKRSGAFFDGLNENLTATVSRGNATSYVLTGLLSDTHYTVNVTAFTETGNGTTGIGNTVYLPRGDPPPLPPDSNFTIGVPPLDASGTAPVASTSTIPITFDIPETLNANGPITRVRIIVRPFGSTANNLVSYIASSQIPLPNTPPYAAIEVDIAASRRKRLTKREENGDMTISETIGTEVNCGVDDEVCNGPLKPGTEYQFKYRAYNSEDDDVFVESQYSPPISTASLPSSNSTIIIAIVVVIVVLIALLGVVIIVVVIIVRRRRKRKLYSFGGNGTSETLLRDGSSKAKLINAGPSIVPLSENVSVTKDNLKPVSVKATPNSRKIYLRDLPGYVTDMISDSGFKFSEEYEKVSAVGLDHSRDASLLPENRAKNRYTNILAYDHSRVKLDYVDDEPGSDYINANYIPGYKIRRAYIASQGPLPSTFDDFWTMVWQQNVHNIVMLTQLVERGRTKCHRYWPGSQPEVYGDITVEMSSEQEVTDWVIRTFELIKDKRSRTVYQFQFISWPDHGVPETATAAIDFVSCVHASVQAMHGPVLVHCSAGVGRTGTFIALGTLLHHIKDHDWVDIFGLACEMRQHRNHMIQTEAQYIFIHKAMVEICQSLSTFSNGKKMQAFNPVYINVGAGMSPDVSQQSDYMFGNSLLSEETTQFTNKSSYDESKF